MQEEDVASKRKGLLWALGALGLGVLLAYGLTPFAHAIPWSWEKRLGRAIDVDLGTKECRPSPQEEVLLKRLVARVYPLNADEAAQPLEVRVVKDDLVNAYAALGGRITVNSALLLMAESPEEVAGVLAHEIEHVRHRHVMEGAMVQLVSWQGLRLIFGGTPSAGLIRALLRMDFTKAQEAQADKAGLERLQRAHVDTKALGRFFERMKKDQPGLRFLSDHPDDDDRIKMAEEHPTAEPKAIMTADEWKILRSYCP